MSPQQDWHKLETKYTWVLPKNVTGRTILLGLQKTYEPDTWMQSVLTAAWVISLTLGSHESRAKYHQLGDSNSPIVDTRELTWPPLPFSPSPTLTTHAICLHLTCVIFTNIAIMHGIDLECYLILFCSLSHLISRSDSVEYVKVQHFTLQG